METKQETQNELPVKNEEEPKKPFEFSFLLIKPNAVKTGLTGVLRQELVEAGIDVVTEKDTRIDRFGGEVFYHSLGDKKDEIIEHITSGDSHVFVVCGDGVIGQLREIQGHTAWKDRPAKGLRGKYAFDHIQNSTHCPDSHKEAVDEFNLVFPDIRDELLNSQLGEELHGFLNDKEAIEKGEKHLSTYAV